MARPKKPNHPLAVALADVGKPKVHILPKEKDSGGKLAVSSSKYYYPPTLHLDQTDFPGCKEFSVGQVVNLAITAEVSGVSTNDTGNEKEYHASLKITQISDITPRKGA